MTVMVMVIAEAGCNHMGRMDLALQLIESAVICGATAIKFQKRCPRELLTPAEYAAPHPVPRNAYGPTYGAHREALELTAAQHAQLQRRCMELGIIYSTSVWDLTSAREIAALKPAYIKIPSAHNTNYPLLEFLCTQYQGELHIALGMTTRAEEQELVDFLDRHGRLGDCVLYACTSGYPVADDELCLREITRLRETWGPCLRGVGFSGHHTGTAPDIAALTLGAECIERHFTLDRTFRGTDHAASLEPYALHQLCAGLKSAERALAFKDRELLAVEEVQRAKLKYRPAPPQP